MPSKFKKYSLLVPAIIIAAVSIEPALHHWLDGYHTEDAVSTGLHTADSAIYLHAMEMLHNGFYSPYATCKAPNGANDIAFLPAPFHWLYALIGLVGHSLGIKSFLFLGWANAFFGAIYLWAVYRFLCTIIPRYARTAFILFVASGSVGGILYLIGLIFGWQNQPGFDSWFLRLSMYELVEGPYLTGTQHLSRLYYTLPLAFVYGAMTAFIQSLRIQCNRHLFLTSLMLFAATFLNIRIGGLGFLLMMLYLFATTGPFFKTRAKLAIHIAIPVAVAFTMFAAMTMMNSTYMENTGAQVREVMWLTSFLSVTALHLIVCRRPVRDAVANLPPLAQRVAFATLGYLALYCILFVGHQIYYGNFMRAGDFSAAMTVSDWALIGVLFGLKKPSSASVQGNNEAYPWLVLWLLTFTAISLSAFGQGWFLRLTPQRLMLFLGVPLSACSAYALHTWAAANRRAAIGYGATMITLGIISMIVGALFFQGPLGRKPGEGPFPNLHPEIMTRADARLLQNLPEGRILTPDVFSDVLALRNNVQVLGGAGNADLSDVTWVEIIPLVAAFFADTTTNDQRKEFLVEWCIDYVYCPDTWPVEGSVRQQLKTMFDTIVIDEDSQGLLLKIRSDTSINE